MIIITFLYVGENPFFIKGMALQQNSENKAVELGLVFQEFYRD